jgi:hypothetical protein
MHLEIQAEWRRRRIEYANTSSRLFPGIVGIERFIPGVRCRMQRLWFEHKYDRRFGQLDGER